MKWQTKISTITDDGEIIRGEKLSTLIENSSFSESIYFLLRGIKPSPEHTAMFDALLTAAIDHGLGTPSTTVARTVASTKNSTHTAVAAGILAMGERHGNAIESAAYFFQKNKSTDDVLSILREMKENGERVPGFGHAVMTQDTRSELLIELAKKYGVYGEHIAFAQKVSDTLNSISSKPLPLNIDGSMAAILSDMGFDAALMKGIFIIARVPGLVAHVCEEQTDDIGIRRVPLEDCEYLGD